MMTTTNRSAPRRLLLTGAAGRIGSAFFMDARERYWFRLADREPIPLVDAASGGHEVIALNVADPEACQEACRGIDTVVHLAADPSPEADFYDSLLENNIKGTYNIFRAAADQGCRRVIFASSIHAVVGHPPEMSIPADAPVRPMNMYGVSKGFGEALAACFAHDGALSSIAIRIGAYDAAWLRPSPPPDAMSAFLSHRDMNQLLGRCIDVEHLQFAIVHGISNNRVQRLNLSSTRELLGYAPEDDAFDLFATPGGD